MGPLPDGRTGGIYTNTAASPKEVVLELERPKAVRMIVR